MHRCLPICTSLVLGVLVCSSGSRATIITPGGYANTAGASDNCIPFTCRRVDRYQQVYDASGFGGASGILSSIAFRLDNVDVIVPGAFDPPIDNGSFSLHLDLLVTLSHTAVTSQSVTNQLIAPGSDALVVLDGTVDDWYQIKKLPREALPYYQRAWQLSRTAPSPPGSASTTLNVPVRVYYPTPQIVADAPAVHGEENYVQVEFTVAADGSVRDARIVDRDTSEHYAQEIFDAVRAARFRPKFVDGQAVAAPGITYREVFWTSMPHLQRNR